MHSQDYIDWLPEKQFEESKIVLARAGVPVARQSQSFATFEGDDTDYDAVSQYAEEWTPGRNLVLIGTLGCGKTGLVVSAMHVVAKWFMSHEPSMMDEDEPVVRVRPSDPIRYRDATMMFSMLRAGFDNGTYSEQINDLLRAEILVIDDLAIERTSEWTREQLRMIVNQRYNAQKSTWVVTNLMEQDLINAIGEYTFWRLAENGAIITMVGSNIREISS